MVWLHATITTILRVTTPNVVVGSQNKKKFCEAVIQNQPTKRIANSPLLANSMRFLTLPPHTWKILKKSCYKSILGLLRYGSKNLVSQKNAMARIMFDVRSIKAKIGLFEFNHQNMNMLEKMIFVYVYWVWFFFDA